MRLLRYSEKRTELISESCLGSTSPTPLGSISDLSQVQYIKTQSKHIQQCLLCLSMYVTIRFHYISHIPVTYHRNKNSYMWSNLHCPLHLPNPPALTSTKTHQHQSQYHHDLARRIWLIGIILLIVDSSLLRWDKGASGSARISQQIITCIWSMDSQHRSNLGTPSCLCLPHPSSMHHAGGSPLQVSYKERLQIQ